MRTRRLMLMAAALLLLAATCTTSQAAVYSRELAQPGDFSFGIFERVEMSEAAGGLILTKGMNCLPYLWVPSPDDSVVTKIDARSGKEIARYQMGPEGAGWMPCAVAADNAGNAYIACGTSGAGKIVKIQASAANRSIQNGPEVTSFDPTGSGKAEALAWGKDSRVSVLAEVGSKPNALTFDEQGTLWVGLWGERSIVALETGTGTVVNTIPLPGKPDTMIAGSRSSLWVLCGQDGRLVRIDTTLGTVRETLDLGQTDAVSLCEGDEKTLWIGTSTGLLQFDTSSASVVRRSRVMTALGGITLDKAGNIWAACPALNQVTRFSPSDLGVTGQVPAGISPVSVATDEDGYVWALNTGSANATRVDPRTTTRVGTTQTAGSPYSSTPFTAGLLKPGISPSGSWRGLFDSKIVGAGWGTISWATTLASSKIRVEARTAATPMAIADQEFQPVMNGQESSLPNGQYLEVRVSFTGGMNTTPILRGMRVDGRNLPPDTSQAAPTMSIIRRLDHKFETVGITGVSDPEGDPVSVVVTGVTQDEPAFGLWQGDKGPDATGVGTKEAQLRCECDPGTAEKPGNGRIYTISFRATDALGASSTGKVKVMVPASLAWDAVAVEDKAKYDSTKDPAKLMAKA